MIRNAKPQDYPAIYEVIKTAFLGQMHSNHKEQIIVQKLLKDNALALSLVVEQDGAICGYVAFSPVGISDGSRYWYGLGPVAVLPEFQKRGFGKKLILEGIKRLEMINAQGCVVLGEPHYYNRFGFINQPTVILEGVPQEYFMALALNHSKMPTGTVSYHPAFFE